MTDPDKNIFKKYKTTKKYIFWLWNLIESSQSLVWPSVYLSAGNPLCCANDKCCFFFIISFDFLYRIFSQETIEEGNGPVDWHRHRQGWYPAGKFKYTDGKNSDKAIHRIIYIHEHHSTCVGYSVMSFIYKRFADIMQ